MEGILIALAALTPLNVFLMILGGVIFGFVFREYWVHTRTVYLMLVFVAMFSIGRFIFVGAASSATGAGLLGTILFLIYLISALVTRRIFRKKHDL